MLWPALGLENDGSGQAAHLSSRLGEPGIRDTRGPHDGELIGRVDVASSGTAVAYAAPLATGSQRAAVAHRS